MLAAMPVEFYQEGIVKMCRALHLATLAILLGSSVAIFLVFGRHGSGVPAASWPLHQAYLLLASDAPHGIDAEHPRS
jgi:hypothetical protein